MGMDTNHVERLLEGVAEFPALPHNLLSTATDDERREAIAAILRWWNGEIVPILTEIRRSERSAT